MRAAHRPLFAGQSLGVQNHRPTGFFLPIVIGRVPAIRRRLGRCGDLQRRAQPGPR